MTKKVVWTPAHKARITKLVEEWAGVLFLSAHHINIVFSERAKSEDDRPGAECEGNYPYESGHRITFYPQLLELKERRMQSRAVLHELSHLLTGTLKHLLWRILVKEQMMMWHEVRDHDERLTDWFANVVFKLSGK